MKNFVRSIPMKALLYLLTAAFLLICIATGTAAVTLEAIGFYNQDRDDLKSGLLSEKLKEEAYKAIYQYKYSGSVFFDPNFRYSISDEFGKPLAGEKISDEKYQRTYHYYYWQEIIYSDSGSDGREYIFWDLYPEGTEYFDGNLPEMATTHYVLQCGYAADPTPTGDLYWIDRGIDQIFFLRAYLPWIAVSSLLLMLAGMITLCTVSGRKKDTEAAVLTGMNKIPFDLFAILLGAAGIGFGVLIAVVLNTSIPSLWAMCLPVLAYLISLLTVWLIASLAARIKFGGLWRKTVLGWLLCRIGRGLKRAFRFLLEMIRKSPTVPAVALNAALIAIFNIFLGAVFQDAFIFLILTVESVLGFFIAVTVALGFAAVQKHAKSIADGNLDHKIDTKYLIGPLKKHGEELNRISDGLNTAVGERIRSERMKTELITNVSHDIKTPLTSIINYVDLLSKETEMNENTAEYLLILQRQSARLKKLTEDIVEASKASTGAIVLELSPCDLGVLLEQTAGEYEEKLQAENLQVILAKPENEVTVLADGRRLWRVFDNLMNNVCKYALPGTRVYLGITEENGTAVVTFRNISKDPLNVSPEELTERFVRGDESRHSEGSGLGLAIARSLTELQKGIFEIAIDGDLFKVTVTFPILK